MYDKERLFGYRRVSKVNIYRMNEFEDYYYGYMVPDSGYLKNFALHLYDEGFVLQMPFRKEPDVVPALNRVKAVSGIKEQCAVGRPSEY